MRVVWSLSLVFLACGGRTIGDPIFDDVAHGGALVAGGRAAGGQAAGGRAAGGRAAGGQAAGGRSGTGGATPSTGGATPSTGGTSFGGSFGFGGQISTGGRLATGGRPSTGGTFSTGGITATGGTGSGGAPFVDKSCVQICAKIQGLCGVLPDQCTVGCSQLVSRSPECQAATRELLDCVSKALSSPQTTCNTVGATALLYCSDLALKVNSCR